MLWARRFRYVQIKSLGSDMALPQGNKFFLSEYILYIFFENIVSLKAVQLFYTTIRTWVLFTSFLK